MHRRVIPTKLIETIEVPPYRANLRRWEHYEGQTPTYSVEIWRVADLLVMDESVGEPAERWSNIRAEMATRVAKVALGLENDEQPTSRSRKAVR